MHSNHSLLLIRFREHDKKLSSRLADFGRYGDGGVWVNPLKKKIRDENLF